VEEERGTGKVKVRMERKSNRGKEVVQLGEGEEEVVVLDSDLVDCRSHAESKEEVVQIDSVVAVAVVDSGTGSESVVEEVDLDFEVDFDWAFRRNRSEILLLLLRYQE